MFLANFGFLSGTFGIILEAFGFILTPWDPKGEKVELRHLGGRIGDENRAHSGLHLEAIWRLFLNFCEKCAPKGRLGRAFLQTLFFYRFLVRFGTFPGRADMQSTHAGVIETHFSTFPKRLQKVVQMTSKSLNLGAIWQPVGHHWHQSRPTGREVLS